MATQDDILKQAYQQYLATRGSAPKGGLRTGVDTFKETGESAGTKFGSGDWLGGIGDVLIGGAKGLSEVVASPEGKSLLSAGAGAQGMKEYEKVLADDADKASGEEAARAQAYKQAEAERVKQLGDYIKAMESEETTRGVASLQQGTEAQKMLEARELDRLNSIDEMVKKGELTLEQAKVMKENPQASISKPHNIFQKTISGQKYTIKTPQQARREAMANNAPEISGGKPAIAKKEQKEKSKRTVASNSNVWDRKLSKADRG